MENDREFDSQEFDGEFPSVDPDYLKITVDEILSGGGVEAEEMDYTVAVPTPKHAITRKTSVDVNSSVFDDAARSLFAEKRGTLGGC
ncbi:hypothetical protein QUA70_12905 [Microcoleus sp. LAD1_D5]|uniref:hypothetical protein n=1 Tax=unclassified Microcoleus TaxID=2642155 RepID=UPI002FD38F73